jgi:hypothetical protein
MFTVVKPFISLFLIVLLCSTAYDISLYLRNNWAELKPDLKGKIRVSVGDQDNFLLNYAVHVLDDEMQKVNAEFVFALLSR